MRFMILALALIGQMAIAQNQQDVIYKKDGSILRGTLIEQDFENGRYKIQLAGGSIFSVGKADIEKITKEEKQGSNNTAGVNINIENNPTINQSPKIEQNSSNQQNPYLAAYYARNKVVPFEHVIMVGYMGQTIVDSNDYGVRYNGLNIAHQYNFTKHLAINTNFTNATFTGIVEDGETYETSGDGKLRILEVSGILSSNNYRGVQFYTGLGIFNDSYSSSANDASNSFTGASLTLGMAYSWRTIQAHLRAGFKNSNDYDSELSVSNANLQIGFNF